jgi:hypothetical protein
VPAAAQTGVDWRSSINTIDPDAAVATIDIEAASNRSRSSARTPAA